MRVKTSILKVNTPCIVCGENSFNPIYSDSLLQCEKCKYTRANMDLSLDELREIYGHSYFHGDEYIDYVAEKESLQRNFQKRIKKIGRVIGLEKLTTVHEIGCAYGFFGEQLLKNTPAKYTGFDIAGDAINEGNKQLDLDLREVDYAAATAGKATDVFMWDVIEHLANPEIYLTKVHENLSEEGRVYITTGDIERRLPRWQKHKWRMIHPPTHLHYFSKASLTKLLENHGFKVVHCSYPPISRSVRQIFYSLFMLKKRPGSITRGMYKMIPKRFRVSVNTFDILFVIAVKTNE